MLSQDEDDDVPIVFDKNRKIRSIQLIHKSSEFEKWMEIGVLLREDKVLLKGFTMLVPPACDEMDIVATIFPDSSVLRDNAGYKIRTGNIEQQAEVTRLNVPRRHYQYVIDIQSEIIAAPECASPASIENKQKKSNNSCHT